METAEVRQVVDRLIGSAGPTMPCASQLKEGILAQLNEPRTLSYISEHSGVPTVLVERVLDILVSINLVNREKDVFTVDQGMLPLITEPVKTFYLSNLLANYFESQDLMDSAGKPTVTIGLGFY